MKKYVLFVGVDISKAWIDVAITPDGQKRQMLHHRFSNTLKGFEKMMKWLDRSTHQLELVGPWLICMEHTGVYTIPLCHFLHAQGLDYVLEAALRIKRSLGLRRGKDDQADSKAIARYLYLHHKDLKISSLPAKSLLALKHLLAYRDRLIKKLHAIKVAAKEAKAFMPEDETIDWITEDSEQLSNIVKTRIKNIETRMSDIVQADPQIKKVFDLATSVKGIGPINALQIIIHTNCFKAFDSARQFACYIGIAPFHKRSGTTLNRPAKVSPLGHKKLKALLGNGVMSAIQNDKELKAYYERKIAQGKIKYKVLNAVKNKLLARVFATVKRGTPYVELFHFS